MEESLRSGEVARRAGVTVQTLRHYERLGLLPRPGRTPSGYRQYPAGTVGLVRFIRRAQGLGFTLREVEEFLDLAADPRGDCADVCEAVRSKMAELDRSVRELRSRRRSLAALLRACPETVPIGECPIVARLSGGSSDDSGSIRKRRAKGGDSI